MEFDGDAQQIGDEETNHNEEADDQVEHSEKDDGEETEGINGAEEEEVPGEHKIVRNSREGSQDRQTEDEGASENDDGIEEDEQEQSDNQEKDHQQTDSFEKDDEEDEIGEENESTIETEDADLNDVMEGTSSAADNTNKRVRRIMIDSDEEEEAAAARKPKLDEEGDGEEGELDKGEHSDKEKEENDKDDEDEADNTKEEGRGDVSELMQNIFGDDMSDDEEDKQGGEVDEEEGGVKRPHGSDDDEPKLLRVEHSEDEDEDLLGRQWDFDVMLAKKKSERRRRRRRDGSIDLMADADDQIKALVDAMNEAAADDRNANIDRRPAVKKRKMLPIVKNILLKADLFEAMLDNGMISAISEWLAPLPDKSLPALEIRCSLLKILERWPNLEQGILKQSGLGKAVMYLFKHPKETKENKIIAAKLIREWSRPIFQLESDFRSLSKEERTQRDLSQMPLAKRKRLSIDDESGIPIFSAAKKLQEDGEEAEKRPGDPGFVPRARVPKLSTRDYVVRPRPEIEAQFRGETKNKQTSRFAKTQREFRQKNQTGKLQRAVGVSISGKNL